MAFVQAAAKIEVLPNPDPFGVSIISEFIINPDPRRSKISDKSPPVLGIMPHTNKAAFCKEKGSNGSSTSCISSIFSYSHLSSKSFDSRIIFLSFIILVK
jgi:hypothetical protein